MAEQASFELAYDSARLRHPDRGWPALPWLDALRRFVLPEPIVVRGALSFHLPEVHGVLAAQGLVPRGLDLAAHDGSDAVAAAFAADAEARLRGVTLGETEQIARVARRAESHCLALCNTLRALRERL